MIEKIKSWLGLAAAIVIGALLFILRGQKKSEEDAKTNLAKALFKNETQENDKAYEDAKSNANRLVDEYERARRTTSDK